MPLSESGHVNLEVLGGQSQTYFDRLCEWYLTLMYEYYFVVTCGANRWICTVFDYWKTADHVMECPVVFWGSNII